MIIGTLLMIWELQEVGMLGMALNGVLQELGLEGHYLFVSETVEMERVMQQVPLVDIHGAI